MTEIWRDIPGYEGLYQASNAGRIKSLKRDRFRNRNGSTEWFGTIKERILMASINKRGYYYVVLRKNGKDITREVHGLVALAFFGLRPQSYQVRHLDGDRLNNRVNNLQYGSRSENQLDLYTYRGYHHKLTADDVLDIRKRLQNGEKGRDIAARYGVSESNISCIKHGGTYKWLS